MAAADADDADADEYRAGMMPEINVSQTCIGIDDDARR